MKNELRDPELRSPEVQEIIGRVPSAVTRWGITIVFSMIVLLFVVSWFIRYPDLLNAKVTIGTFPAPVTLVSRAGGTLVLLKKENDEITRGKLIGYLRSNADPLSVLALEQVLAENTALPKQVASGSLGDLEPFWGDLVKSNESFKLFRQNNSFQKQIAQLKKQRNSYLKLSATQESQQKLAKQELVLAKEKFKTDSILYNQKVLSTIDFNQSKTNWLQQMRNAKTMETSVINTEIQIDQIDKQISDLEIKETEDSQRYNLDIKNSLSKLKAAIEKWKESYLFISPIDGRLAYLAFLENEQFVDSGKPCFSVVPDLGTIVAKAELPIRGSGKVKEGQMVNIRLENYPFEQFGMLKGKVSAISTIPGDDKYRITIELPDQLISTQHKTLVFKQQLTGNTEIITEDLRLLERFIFQFRRLLKRG